ncbi:hypothetical protein HK097_010596 [Rhizophlyctis rosea]|uniref:Uncharacterized protein n=1 Tax=Rhizophlyctis rosea TaxID=64517 RepID=A0AAD5SK46_9FUNG|nr:hypothetical protein HK097_010596 [Rhizophlyctis rosea]
MSMHRERKFVSPPMVFRDRRLREARIHADCLQREMRRDRLDLERRERLLLSQLRAFASKGDIYKAKLIAQQIADYRTASDRNFKGSVLIDTRAQLMVSDHTVNRAEVEAIKGIRHANIRENLQTFMEREKKYDERLDMYETMESIMNEGMDEVYDWADDQRRRPSHFEQEMDSIVRQGLDSKHKREYIDRETLSGLRKKIQLNICVYDPNDPPSPTSLKQFAHQQRASLSGKDPVKGLSGATISIPTLDLSIDMLKRLLVKDSFAIRQLGLGATAKSVFDAVLGAAKPFRIGTIVARKEEKDKNGRERSLEGVEFVPYGFTESLKNLGIRNGDLVWVSSDQIEDEE